MIRRTVIFLAGIVLVILGGCTKNWDDYYTNYPETVNENLWDVMQNDPSISKFVELMKENQADSIFQNDIPYTIFAPTNDALNTYLETKPVTDILLGYHVASHVINQGSIHEKRKVQTLTEKFALFERIGSKVLIDGIAVASESPLYKNGRYFIMNQVVEPKPNLYEYFALTNPVLSRYIDTQDSIILDKEQSKPIGFDAQGNTIYDTVSIVFNKFEDRYFPVKHEFRNLSSTIVFPLEDDYNAALDVMADALGGGYNSHSDIPEEWQDEILIPHILKQGVFLNMIEPEEFIWQSDRDTVKLLNILGDSVIINYTPTDKTICSNGYAYNYQNYTIPDSLYNGGTKIEAEWLLDEVGIDKYAWNDSVIVKTDTPLNPLQEYVAAASNDSIIRVLFPKGYTGQYSVQFKSKNLFPRKYVMVVSTHMDIGGIYDIYVNDKLVKTFDYYQYILYRGLMFSVTGDRYIPRGRFNKFDMYVDVEEYGKVDVRFEYKQPGNVLNNGLVLDYVEFIPAKN